MLDRQRQVIDEKLNQVISRLEKLYTKRDEAKAKVEETKNLLLEHSMYCKAKGNLKTNCIMYSILLILTELFIYFVIDYIFSPVNNEFFHSDIIKWELTYIIMPFFCTAVALVASFVSLFDIVRYKEASKIDEEEKNKELTLAEDLSQNISSYWTLIFFELMEDGQIQLCYGFETVAKASEEILNDAKEENPNNFLNLIMRMEIEEDKKNSYIPNVIKKYGVGKDSLYSLDFIRAAEVNDGHLNSKNVLLTYKPR